MSLFYRIAYAIGLAPWEEAERHAPAADHVASIFERAARDRGGPGRALDIGCGGGAWSVEMARRGWQVTGVDDVGSALQRARRRAREAGVEVRLVQADIAAPLVQAIGDGYDFLWDMGAVHGLDAARREAAGRALTAVAAPGARLALLAWRPGRRGPLPRGASAEEIAAAFPAWTIEAGEPFDATGLPPPLRRVEPTMHLLRLG